MQNAHFAIIISRQRRKVKVLNGKKELGDLKRLNLSLFYLKIF